MVVTVFCIIALFFFFVVVVVIIEVTTRKISNDGTWLSIQLAKLVFKQVVVVNRMSNLVEIECMFIEFVFEFIFYFVYVLVDV